VLDAQEYDGDVSGTGAGRWFDRAAFETALSRLKDHSPQDEVQPEIDFVLTCLAALPTDRTSVFVSFI
jgi:hypothetical protein